MIVLVGPSHFVGRDGHRHLSEWGVRHAARSRAGRRDGRRRADVRVAARPAAAVGAHARALARDAAAVPRSACCRSVRSFRLRSGFRREKRLARAPTRSRRIDGPRVLLVASTDLSHYFDAQTATALDARVVECVDRFDADALLSEFERYPEGERGRFVACGGGAAIAVMRAARALGAGAARVCSRTRTPARFPATTPGSSAISRRRCGKPDPRRRDDRRTLFDIAREAIRRAASSRGPGTRHGGSASPGGARSSRCAGAISCGAASATWKLTGLLRTSSRARQSLRRSRIPFPASHRGRTGRDFDRDLGAGSDAAGP